MIATLLAGLAAAPAPQALDLPLDPAPVVVEHARAVLELGETHFSARNLGAEPLLLLVEDGPGGLGTVLPLAPGAVYEEELVRGALAGISLELVRAGRPGTGRLDLDLLLPDAHGRIWLLDCGHARVEAVDGSALLAAPVTGSLLPRGAATFLAPGGPCVHAIQADPGPSHVPVPTPSDSPGGAPPKKRRRQLPPV